MSPTSTYLHAILSRLKLLREEAGISSSELEERLILGPGWIERFEQGETTPSLDMLVAILHVIGTNFSALLDKIKNHPETAEIERAIFAIQNNNNLNVNFKYAKYDAIYVLNTATTEQFEKVIKTLRDGLSRLSGSLSNNEAIKTDSVAKAFLAAVKVWPHANPSDIWWFLIYRAYCDPYNHPAQFARLDFTQSWKRTGGWALEEVLVRHYGHFLTSHGIELLIASTEEKEHYLRSIKVTERLEADKMDVLLIGIKNGTKHIFGVVHVKASFAERRTDDVPMSKALVEAGYISPLWTMDCKSSPSEHPVNKGELGDKLGKAEDKRSAKRKDIEDDGYFSACFSYNVNTKSTPLKQKAKAHIHVCNFNNPDDAFSKFLIESWRKFPHA
jgi:transcriptional regulator with XRE-family HTH domain